MQTAQAYNFDSGPGKKIPVRPRPYSAFIFITEQNAIDAAFLWLLRDRVIKSRLFCSEDIREMDDRIEANLEGISLVGELGWRVCEEQLEYEEPGEVFTAAVVALRSDDIDRVYQVCELALKSEELIRALISALGWVEAELAETWIARFLNTNHPGYRLLGLAGCSVRRKDPGHALVTILNDPVTKQHPALYARALRLIGELKRRALIPFLNAAMIAEDERVRFQANWAAAMLGQMSVVRNLKPWVMKHTPFSDKAIQVAFSALPIPEAQQWIEEMMAQPETDRLSIIKAIGVLGDPRFIPWIVQQMADLKSSRLAGWAFSQITGIELASSNLVIKQPPGLETGPTDDPNDDTTLLDEDEDQPWPDRKKIARLWTELDTSLHPDLRYFLGHEINPQYLQEVYAGTNQQQKEFVAYQLAILNEQASLMNTSTCNKTETQPGGIFDGTNRICQ